MDRQDPRRAIEKLTGADLPLDGFHHLGEGIQDGDVLMLEWSIGTIRVQGPKVLALRGCVRKTHWRQGQHKTDQRALGRDPVAWRLHSSGHGYRVADAAQARGLSTPERACHRAA